MSHLAQARRVFDIELAALRAVRARLDASFDRAVELVVATLQNRGKLVVIGIGKSGNIGAKLAATLTSTGSPTVLLNSVDALHGDLGIINDGDLLLALSYSGESDELLNLLPAFKRFAVRLITFTGNPKSTLARHSDVVLNVRVPREACPFNLAPTASTTAMLVLGDALAIALLEARKFTSDDFAKLHPAGALGRKLTYSVRDLMAHGDGIPVVADTATLTDAMLEMSRKRFGATAVVSNERVLGIITDGDIRRFFQREPPLDPRTTTAESVMSREPRSVTADTLAADALMLMEHRSPKVLQLLVVDDAGRLEGIIHMHDIVRTGIRA